MNPILKDALQAHHAAVEGFITAHAKALEALAARLADGFLADKKLLLCGNGGSATDAMHTAGELVGRFVHDRRPLPAIALVCDTGAITAIGNDYGFEQIFSRQIEALGTAGDTLIALSTSGQSPNILKALEAAKARGLHTVLLTGERGKDSKAAAEVFAVPATETARIQEAHLCSLHLLVALIEAELAKRAAL